MRKRLREVNNQVRGKADSTMNKMKDYLHRVYSLNKKPLADEKKTSVPFTNAGFCYSCNQASRFTATRNWWRDYYVCNNCGSIPRERAVMYCIEKFYPDWREKVIHESSPVFRGTSLRLKSEAKEYCPTQYFPGIERGVVHRGFRNEDLEQLTFADQSIDLHVTQYVFEHIFDPAQAFREIARTLKPGGAHIFTTPLVNKNSPTQWCARRGSGGEIEHLIDPPEYHGNPVSAEGSLVTVHWGYDILKFIFDACGLFTEMIYIDALDLGIRAEFIEVLITRK
jgi:SAM-dependent methyltransferase